MYLQSSLLSVIRPRPLEPWLYEVPSGPVVRAQAKGRIPMPRDHVIASSLATTRVPRESEQRRSSSALPGVPVGEGGKVGEVARLATPRLACKLGMASSRACMDSLEYDERALHTERRLSPSRYGVLWVRTEAAIPDVSAPFHRA